MNLVIREAGGSRPFSVRTTSDRQNPKRPIIGVLPIQALHAQLPFPIKFNLRKVGGPSAGLAFALELLEQRDATSTAATRSRRPARSSLDGSVTRIGGIKQKTIGARKSHVDVFLVPVDGDNARGREALRAWPEDHPCEDFSTGVARTGNTPEKG